LKAALRWGAKAAATADQRWGNVASIIRPAAAAGGAEISELSFAVASGSSPQASASMILLNDPKDSPRILFVECRDEIVKVALPAPESDGSILLLKDLNDPEDARFVRLLRDPDVIGDFK
jgi:hypothetical protein